MRSKSIGAFKPDGSFRPTFTEIFMPLCVVVPIDFWTFEIRLRSPKVRSVQDDKNEIDDGDGANYRSTMKGALASAHSQPAQY